MNVERIEALRVGAGWRMFPFSRMTPACRFTGWPEYGERFSRLSSCMSAHFFAAVPDF